MTQQSPSSHPHESNNAIPPDIIKIVQSMYQDQAEEVINRLNTMDTGVRKVVLAAIKGAHWAIEKNELWLEALLNG